MEKHSGLFVVPFSKEYWRLAAGEVRSVRILALTALFIALRIVVASFFIPLAADGSQRVYFSFFVNALGSLIYGPVNALMAGFASDIIGYAINPVGAFFPGYVLTSMMGSFFYALFFYRARITWLRVFLCKLSVNLFVNVGLGSLWNAMIYGKAFYYYAARSVVKNAALLIPEVLLLGLFLQLILSVVARTGLAPKQPTKVIPLW